MELAFVAARFATPTDQMRSFLHHLLLLVFGQFIVGSSSMIYSVGEFPASFIPVGVWAVHSWFLKQNLQRLSFLRSNLKGASHSKLSGNLLLAH
ncbi:hypothetical protein L484_006671 [Morus notabilis]|uniref:Uncharacterized protein n=1 Tax=Morus notabilis TaxID=981085 RepID=W9SEG7_9ROSA|nr:hypothetical protein L484_006671 [Morus notabilis]